MLARFLTFFIISNYYNFQIPKLSYFLIDSSKLYANMAIFILSSNSLMIFVNLILF